MLAAGILARGEDMISVVGDPGMFLPPSIQAEGWNMCNKASDLPTPHCQQAPRWADCAPLDGSKPGPGPNGNLVTPADNAAGIPAGSPSAACDAAAEAKERTLGGKCSRTSAANQSYSFWTSMIKSGNFDVNAECVLCGLWCKDIGCCPSLASLVPESWPVSAADVGRAGRAGRGALGFNNLNMNQPTILQQWSALQPDGHYAGSFYGTYDRGVTPPPPSDVDLFPAAPSPCPVLAGASKTFVPHQGTGPSAVGPLCDITGTWLGTDASHPVSVVMAASGAFVANAGSWPSARHGTVSANGSVVMADGGGSPVVHHGRVGRINASAPVCSAVLWDGEGAWCREPVCSPSVTPSYLSIEWFWRGGSYVYRNTLRTNPLYPWLMIYTGADTTRGWKGGYPWDGRGVMTSRPLSSPTWPHNDFRVRFWVNISHLDTSSSFYFLNTGSCWQMDGSQCTGDVTRDVTRYILMDLNAAPHTIGGPGGRKVRCGPLPADRAFCPLWHRRGDGSRVSRDDVDSFPYEAYIYAGPASPQAAGVSLTPERSLFLGHFDNFSNPQAQDFVKIAPSAEWAQYGFPASRQEVMAGPRMWELNVGQFTSTTPMLGQEPTYRAWATLNVGPEMGLGDSSQSVNVWEVARFDVLAYPNRTIPA